MSNTEKPKPTISYGKLLDPLKKTGHDPELAAGSMVDEAYERLQRWIRRHDPDYGQGID